MQSQSQKPHLMRLWVYVLIFIRVLLLCYLYYQYLVSKTEKAPTKGGTLVEGVTSRISYIPYISKSVNDRFYQNLLFQWCQTYFTSWSKIFYEPELCDVITDDNKTYVVSIAWSGGTWSDNTPVTIDDLIFTYEKVLKENIRSLPHGEAYQNIGIQKLSNNSISVTFWRSSIENMEFFINPILPSHIVWDKDREWYETEFAQSPTTNGCATLSNSRDANSVIFDVLWCSKTRIRYYQVKNTTVEAIQQDPWIIDMYIGGIQIPNYKTGNVMTNDYIWLFFNMQRGKLSVYGRKNMIALVNKYIYLPENNLPIIKEHFLFENYPTDVSDKSTIKNVASWENSQPIRLIYYEKDQLYVHIVSIIKNILETEWLIDYFEFVWYADAQTYLDALNSKDYDITLQTIPLWVKKDISSMFLVDSALSNPSLYVNANLAKQISDYFVSPLSTQYNIKWVIAKLYSTDIPFFILWKSTSFINIKKDITLETNGRFDIATARYKVFNNAILIEKPQVTKGDILNVRRFWKFILSELGFK